MTGDAKADRATNALFHRLMDRTDLHIKVPNGRDLGIFPVGMAAELHGPGPEGRCVCCHGRGAA